MLPLSKAVLATMVLFYAVGFWNQWLQPLIYLNDRSRFPMQLILRNIVLGTDAALSKSMSASAGYGNHESEYQICSYFYHDTSDPDGISLRSEVLCKRCDGRLSQGLII